MRVLLDYRPALRHRTGVGEYVHQLARALADSAEGLGPAGPVELVLFTSSWKDRPSPALCSELPHARVVDRRIPVRALTWAWNRAAWPPVEWLAGPCDVVHSQSPLLIPSHGAAAVVTIHDLDFLRHPERAEAEMRRDYPHLARAHAARADAVVVSSHYAAGEVVRELGLPAERVHVCRPGAPDWAAEVRRRRETTPATRILFMGTRGPRKNIGTLLDAYARLRSLIPDAPTLTLAGRPGAGVQPWQARIGEAPLAGHVEMTGYVGEAERRALYATARMLVLPSLDEGFGFPVLEAMACGVPVVISSRGALPEVAGPAAEPVEPDDVAGLAARMAALLDVETARAAAARGLDQAARFSWAACARAARQAYAAALERHAHRG